MDVYVLTSTDRTGTADTPTVLFGVYSSREKATDAILYWMFDCADSPYVYLKDNVAEEFVTNKNIWHIEKVEMDFVI